MFKLSLEFIFCMEPKPGDVVEVETGTEIISGILMPRPEILASDIIVIKLENGYNIGIAKENIQQMRFKEPYQQKKERKEISPPNPNLETVSLLSFGGTISSKVDYRTGGTYADYTAEDFVAMMPELKEIANIHPKKIAALMSEDMEPTDWQLMAKHVVEELNKKEIKGVVVTQGTDTLHFSTAALSFFLKDLHKPVIFTAAQRSIDRGSSDAFMNLVCAINAAAKSDIAEVMTCMHGTTDDDYCLLIRGTKVRKMHTSRRDAFRPINELPFGKIWMNGTIEIINNNYRKRSDGKTTLDVAFEKKTALVYIYPGMDPEIIDFYAAKNYKGIILAATALGHVPTVKGTFSLIPYIERARKKNIVLAITSQTLYGKVHPFVYTNLRKLSITHDVVFLEDMLPETAYIKLGWILGKETDPVKIRTLLLTNIAGELNKRLDDKSFLY